MDTPGARSSQLGDAGVRGNPAAAATTNGGDTSPQAGDSTTTTSPLEPLACVTCRSRKLKCDRIKPSCTRCAKAPEGGPCVYPESRRKPVFKRRNVKDLEARLAQVEGLLKDNSASERKRAADSFDSGLLFVNDKSTVVPFAWGADPDDVKPDDDVASFHGLPGPSPPAGNQYELIGLGMTEATPPFEVIEDLHRIYFEHQQTYVPIVHPARYLRAYHSAPHLRPPMGLQYIMWALAAQGNPRYNSCHDIFYRRARQYLEADEMRGTGEHFITVAHAQAWALVTTYEARRMFFTRAAMSCARTVRLSGIMGLNHLDDEGSHPKSAPTLLPAKDWTELEERRRVFWAAFCVDSHASISTGWPSLINPSDITTLMPASEDAFLLGIEEPSTRLENAFSDFTYSTFASSIIICHIFNSILRHVQSKPSDRPFDFQNGRFWQRHRDLDTMLSSAFVFLPERYRMPRNMRDPVAVHANLNLHAATICLHNAALDRAQANNLPEAIKKDCQSRLLVAAQEIVNIMKLTSRMATNYKTPLASLSLYCAASVFVHQATMDEKKAQQQQQQQQQQQHVDESSPESAEEVSLVDTANLEFIFHCLDSLARNNNITVMFLQQAILDMRRSDLATSTNHAWFKKYRERSSSGNHYIPILAMSAISKPHDLNSPLPGRLPLTNPALSSHPLTDTDTEPQQVGCTGILGEPCFGYETNQGPGPAIGKPAKPAAALRADNSNNKRRRIKSPAVASSSSSVITDKSTISVDNVPSPTMVLPHRAATPVVSSVVSSAVTTAPTTLGDNVTSLGDTMDRPPTSTPLSADMFSQISILDPWEGSAPPGLGNAADANVAAIPALQLGLGDMADGTGLASQFSASDPGLMWDASFMYAQLSGVARASGFSIPQFSGAATTNQFSAGGSVPATTNQFSGGSPATTNQANMATADPWALFNSDFEK